MTYIVEKEKNHVNEVVNQNERLWGEGDGY